MASLPEPEPEPHDERSFRALIYIPVLNIPGDPLARSFSLSKLFCASILHRDVNTQNHSVPFDEVHVPAGFDEAKDIKRWFILDVEVKKQVEKDKMDTIDHKCYLGCKSGDELCGNLYARC